MEGRLSGQNALRASTLLDNFRKNIEGGNRESIKKFIHPEFRGIRNKSPFVFQQNKTPLLENNIPKKRSLSQRHTREDEINSSVEDEMHLPELARPTTTIRKEPAPNYAVENAARTKGRESPSEPMINMFPEPVTPPHSGFITEHLLKSETRSPPRLIMKTLTDRIVVEEARNGELQSPNKDINTKVRELQQQLETQTRVLKEQLAVVTNENQQMQEELIVKEESCLQLQREKADLFISLQNAELALQTLKQEHEEMLRQEQNWQVPKESEASIGREIEERDSRLAEENTSLRAEISGLREGLAALSSENARIKQIEFTLRESIGKLESQNRNVAATSVTESLLQEQEKQTRKLLEQSQSQVSELLTERKELLKRIAELEMSQKVEIRNENGKERNELIRRLTDMEGTVKMTELELSFAQRELEKKSKEVEEIQVAYLHDVELLRKGITKRDDELFKVKVCLAEIMNLLLEQGGPDLCDRAEAIYNLQKNSQD
eukprot:TRINITY_DN4998_c0_g1_i2.p1 TRINITY_DN4998_c0_g1~~TRINITY_DN4998_c0_g1_i2.p1  ORF type:complete len:493 (-),score=94.77 TRINITY_DN4998_c0_g1_i2:114-1592(-)